MPSMPGAWPCTRRRSTAWTAVSAGFSRSCGNWASSIHQARLEPTGRQAWKWIEPVPPPAEGGSRPAEAMLRRQLPAVSRRWQPKAGRLETALCARHTLHHRPIFLPRFPPAEGGLVCAAYRRLRRARVCHRLPAWQPVEIVSGQWPRSRFRFRQRAAGWLVAIGSGAVAGIAFSVSPTRSAATVRDSFNGLSGLLTPLEATG